MENFGGDFVEFLKIGGLVMWILAIMSVIALAFIIERAIALWRAKINVNEFLAKIRKALIVNHSVRDAIKVCEQYRGPVASIMKAGLLKYGQPKEDIEKTIENAALYEMGRLERGLTVLATIANVAPLLGFLIKLVQLLLHVLPLGGDFFELLHGLLDLRFQLLALRLDQLDFIAQVFFRPAPKVIGNAGLDGNLPFQRDRLVLSHDCRPLLSLSVHIIS